MASLGQESWLAQTGLSGHDETQPDIPPEIFLAIVPIAVIL